MNKKPSNIGTLHPKVSVVAVSYNQREYITRAIEGFLAQKTNFDIEIVICDDASTDGTAKIIENFASTHPDLIKPVLRKKNIGVQRNVVDAFQRAKGEYVAFCEGDDFWTDPFKLQAQVDFLEKNPDCSICFHPVRVSFENNEEPDCILPVDKTGFTLEKLLKENFIQTNSVMYKRQDYANLPIDILPLDWYLHLYHAQHGKIGFINEVMSVYRRHESGIWWRSSRSSDFWKKNAVLHINLFKEIIKLFPDREDYKKILQQNIFNIVNEVVEADIENHTTLLEMLHEHYPEDIQRYVFDRYMDDINLRQQHKSDTALIKRLNDEASSREKMIVELREHIKDTQRQLDDIQNSRVWKTRNSVASVVRKRRIK